MPKYEDICFLQGDEAIEALKILDNPKKGVKGLLKYLKQWHFPGEHAIREENPAGSDDNVYRSDGYILSYNSRLGYCGLVHRIEEEEEKCSNDQ